MESMYATLETGGVGLFESPTGCIYRQQTHLSTNNASPSSNHFKLSAGTGKTLSLICSIFQWLEDKQPHDDQDPDAHSDGDQNYCLSCLDGALYLENFAM